MLYFEQFKPFGDATLKLIRLIGEFQTNGKLDSLSAEDLEQLNQTIEHTLNQLEAVIDADKTTTR